MCKCVQCCVCASAAGQTRWRCASEGREGRSRCLGRTRDYSLGFTGDCSVSPRSTRPANRGESQGVVAQVETRFLRGEAQKEPQWLIFISPNPGGKPPPSFAFSGLNSMAQETFTRRTSCMTVNISLLRVPSHFLHAKECLNPSCAPVLGCECT